MMRHMEAQLPSGTVTFLFADIEGSTRLLADIGSGRYAIVLDDYRRIIADATIANDGVVVDLEGDGCFAAFAVAADAASAAMAAQAHLANLAPPIRARMGMHTGTPERTTGGYVGLDVHRAARVLEAAHGGQILVTAASAALLAGDHLHDLGQHRLQDLPAPEHLYQLGEGHFPPVRALASTNLPSWPTPFLGRSGELDEIAALLSRDDVRLLTLTGPGGAGKTRLVAEAARRAVDRYSDGAWWVSLAALRDASLVVDAIAQVLPTRAPVAEFLANRSVLLVLDNLEQVTDAANDIAGLLAASTGLNVLATSRARLHVAAEHEYAVPPLRPSDAEDLFIARARALRADFEPDAAVAAICRRLDELPLAVELAAARVTTLTTDEILERLEARLPLLTGGPRDQPERQRTLRATIDWSYELLGPNERTAFAALAVFAGGSGLDAAEAITGIDLETLTSLVDQSLVRHLRRRFTMLETIREYALERLAEIEVAPAIRDRHAEWFAALAREAEPELVGRGQEVWLQRVADDLDNMRAALAHLLDGGRAAEAVDVAHRLGIFWAVRGHYREGRAWVQRALAAAPMVDGASRARAMLVDGYLALLSDDVDAAGPLLEDALKLGRAAGDGSTVARSLNMLGLQAFFADRPTDAVAMLTEAVAAARDSGDAWCLADSLGTLASIYPLQGEFERPLALGEEGLEIARRMGDRQGMRMALFGLALNAFRRGDVDEASAKAAEGLDISRTIEDRWFTSYFHWLLASAALERGDMATARKAADDALEVGASIAAPMLEVCAREVLARLDAATGRQKAAHVHIDKALAAAGAPGIPASYVSAVHFAAGSVAASFGTPAEAEREFRLASEIAKAIGDTWAAERAARAADTEGGRAV